MVRRVEITRYITPLREGSSLPALVEADDRREYVAKFRGAGHGTKALIAELIVGEIGRSLGLPVPEIVLVDVDPGMGDAEPTGPQPGLDRLDKLAEPLRAGVSGWWCGARGRRPRCRSASTCPPTASSRRP